MTTPTPAPEWSLTEDADCFSGSPYIIHLDGEAIAGLHERAFASHVLNALTRFGLVHDPDTDRYNVIAGTGNQHAIVSHANDRRTAAEAAITLACSVVREAYDKAGLTLSETEE
ncbi:hypothetical protein [Corynebacterium glyciniphilum]|uniref:hypothetical protein n=1 Tax=Corynebacterium glyciniphilum TaxID=1404244 RepID=UPI00264B9077|nr:hypothetical protein [Corynebacterium glyciniphilum]MDN6707404.1 hypothetical protein [Corynebacterium glyciniphilum]